MGIGRIARVVMPGWPHHVTQRGNNRQTVFYKDHDREMYLELLAEKEGIRQIEVCLDRSLQPRNRGQSREL
jgi:REP element-mobilizing transposase RayT